MAISCGALDFFLIEIRTKIRFLLRMIRVYEWLSEVFSRRIKESLINFSSTLNGSAMFKVIGQFLGRKSENCGVDE
jgi:hypothetical protein